MLWSTVRVRRRQRNLIDCLPSHIRHGRAGGARPRPATSDPPSGVSRAAAGATAGGPRSSASPGLSQRPLTRRPARLGGGCAAESSSRPGVRERRSRSMRAAPAPRADPGSTSGRPHPRAADSSGGGSRAGRAAPGPSVQSGAALMYGCRFPRLGRSASGTSAAMGIAVEPRHSGVRCNPSVCRSGALNPGVVEGARNRFGRLRDAGPAFLAIGRPRRPATAVRCGFRSGAPRFAAPGFAGRAPTRGAVRPSGIADMSCGSRFSFPGRMAVADGSSSRSVRRNRGAPGAIQNAPKGRPGRGVLPNRFGRANRAVRIG